VKRNWDCDQRAGPPAEPALRTAAATEEDAAEWARRELEFRADALQAHVLRSGRRRGVLNCSRQWGKSTITAAKALYQATHQAGSLTLVVSPSARQSGEFLRKVTEFARRLGVRPKGDGDNEMSLALPNGSRIVGLPGSEATVRGFSSVALLLVDEAARVSDDLYLAIRPMLAVSDGALWLMSTPHGKRGFFYDTWEKGGEEWERIEAKATECPRISKSFLAGEERAMGPRWFRQEYLCEFEDSVSAIFDRSLIERAFSSEFGVLDV
jgi:hypothetical protein